MATLNFKGKAFVQNHHLLVKYHQLVPRKDRSLTDKVSLHDNLIIHGDNLKALKALLPTYGGKIKCIYIDPPYNTGNEKWVYNDSVNSPMMQDWLGKVVDREDLTRHDKWLCMMMPRLKLLRELLRDDGLIFASIDDNEASHLHLLLDEVFGEENFQQQFVWKNKYGPGAMTKGIGNVHEYLFCYSRTPIRSIEAHISPDEARNYRKRDDKYAVRGPYITQPLATRSKDYRPNLVYALEYAGEEIWPQDQWIWSKDRLEAAIARDEVEFRKSKGKWSVRFKQYLRDENGVVRRAKPISLLIGPFNQDGTAELAEIFKTKVFNNPKPKELLKYLFSMIVDGSEENDFIVLDSFAGSGTAAHAILDTNRDDGGNRRFILVQCDEYSPKTGKIENICDSVTAERARRVIKGVPNAKEEKLRKGLGGSFSYFELGDPIEMESILRGDNLPTYNELARYVFYTATGEEFDEKVLDEKEHFIGESREYVVYLFYQPDLEYLKKTALTLDRARALGPYKDKRRLVFAPTKYLDQDHLDEMRIDFAQLPFEIYQLAK